MLVCACVRARLYIRKLYIILSCDIECKVHTEKEIMILSNMSLDLMGNFHSSKYKRTK